MPLVDLDDGLDIVVNKGPDQVVPQKKYAPKEETQVSLYYNKETPLTNILQTISGYKWSVTYYNQLRDMNDTLVQFDVTASATIQKYNKIKNMLFYVQTPLGLDNAKALSGEAIIRGDFLPNVHDVFIAVLPGGRKAMFTVMNVEDRTSNLNKIYVIQYGILHYIDNSSSLLLRNLEHKVMKTYIYDNKHLATKSSPLLLESTYKNKIDLEDMYKEIVGYYSNNFLNSRGIFSLPTEDGTVFVDNFVTEFFYKTVNTTEYNDLRRMVRLPVDSTATKPYTVLDVLISRRKRDLIRCDMNRMGYVGNVMKYYNNTIYVYYNRLGINYLMKKLEDGEMGEPLSQVKDLSTYYKYYPKNIEEDMFKGLVEPASTKTVINPVDPVDPDELPLTSVDDAFDRDPTPVDEGFIKPELPVEDNSNDDFTLEDHIGSDSELDPGFNHPEGSDPVDPGFGKEPYPGDIDPGFTKPNPPTTIDPDIETDPSFSIETSYEAPILDDKGDYYIFSPSFYKSDLTKLGLIERLVMQYLDDQVIADQDIFKAVSQYHMWSTEDQYNLIPILLFLIKYYINTMDKG